MTTRRSLELRGVALALSALSLAACAGEEKIAPVGSAAPTSTTTTPTPTTTTTTDPPPVKRTVETRDPFGNVKVADNLMWDGDFEWSSAFADQYAWFDTRGRLVDDFAIGASCMSGVKCARVARNVAVVGLAVGSKSALHASIYVRFLEGSGSCDGVDVALFSQGFVASDPDVLMAPTEVDARPGWCHFVGNSPPRGDQTYLYVDNVSDVEVLLDDAVLERVDDASLIALAPVLAAPPRMVEKLDRARDAARAARLPQDGRKERERARFRAWLENQSRGKAPR